MPNIVQWCTAEKPESQVWTGLNAVSLHHYTKIERASNSAQLWRICTVFFSIFVV
jgi:hypothetical protein